MRSILEKFEKSKMEKEIKKELSLESSITGFLAPIVFLCAFFCVVDFFTNGFSSLIYSTIFFVSGFVILKVRFPYAKFSSIFSGEFVHFFFEVCALFYVVGIVLLLLNRG